ERYAKGDQVGVGCFVDSCRTCGSCKDGLENYCESGVRSTYGGVEADGTTPTYGGYSTQIVVDERFVLRIPASLDPAGAAPLLCAGITTYSPLRHVGVTKGTRVAVMGLGGLGHMGVKLAASFGAEVTVLSHSASKKADAERLGAHDFVLTSGKGALAPLAGRFDVILDTISAEHDVNGPLNCLKRDGTLIMVGASPTPIPLATFPLIRGRRSIMGSLVGGLPETQEMLDHCGKHGITSDIEQITPAQINGAFDRAVRGDVKYRFVIDCTKF
ncbi:MAG: NAD(P)-dependent alcohol dehydrogenase, partial [Longimicrobiales bacterium]